MLSRENQCSTAFAARFLQRGFFVIRMCESPSQVLDAVIIRRHQRHPAM
jgi:hypothetical protein